MKILSWMAIGRGKKHTLINTPSRSSSDDQASSWKHSLSLQRQFHPQPVPLLTNPASKFEFPHVQTISLLEQFKTVPPPNTISHHLKKPIRIQILKPPQYLEDLKHIKSVFKWWKTSDYILSLCYSPIYLHPKIIIVHILYRKSPDKLSSRMCRFQQLWKPRGGNNFLPLEVKCQTSLEERLFYIGGQFTFIV